MADGVAKFHSDESGKLLGILSGLLVDCDRCVDGSHRTFVQGSKQLFHTQTACGRNDCLAAVCDDEVGTGGFVAHFGRKCVPQTPSCFPYNFPRIGISTSYMFPFSVIKGLSKLKTT